MTREVHQDQYDRFPRFLDRNHEPPALGDAAIPPSPSNGFFARLGLRARELAAIAAPLMAPASIALCILVLASATLLSRAPAEPPPLVLQKAPEIVPPPSREVANAFALVSAFEARVGYAAHLADHLSAEQNDSSAAMPQVEQTASDGDWEMSNAVGLLVLRNLPPGVTFLTGAPAGDGAWVIPSGEPDQLVMTLGEGFDRPVHADVEMVSRAGLPLGTLRLQLSRPGLESVAAASEAATNEAGEREVAPQKATRKKRRRHRVRNRAQAVAESGTTQRGRPNATDADRQSAAARQKQVASADQAEGEQKGFLAKFVDWLKSAQKPPQDDQSVGYGFQQ